MDNNNNDGHITDPAISFETQLKVENEVMPQWEKDVREHYEKSLDANKSYWLTHSNGGTSMSMDKERIIEFEVELERLYQKLKVIYSDNYINNVTTDIEEFYKNNKDGK